MAPAMKARLALVCAALFLVSTGCSGGEPEAAESSPDELLSAAKTTLDETSGVTLSLEASGSLPPGVQGVQSANGVATHAPAFDGTIQAKVSGIEAEVPVIAIDGNVYADIPLLTSGFEEIDPAQFGAPDPAGLMDPDKGISSILTAAESATTGGSSRGGDNNDEVLTGVDATIAGSTIKQFIPTAQAGDFAAEFQLTEDNELRTVTMTGPFYPDADEVTYTVTITDYGSAPDISAP